MMLLIRSLTNGTALGMAKTVEEAKGMAVKYGWANWYTEDVRDDLELLEEAPSTDPYNMRGRKVPACPYPFHNP